MRPIADEELNRRQSSFAAMFSDRCYILRFASAYAPEATETPCRFRMAAQQAGVLAPVFLSGAQGPGMTITLPPSAGLLPKDRIRMTARKGEAISPTVDYEQVEAPITDKLATIVGLRKVEP